MNKIERVTFASFFLLLFPLIGLSQSGSLDIPGSAGFSVDLKEWLALEISTGSEVSTTQGSLMAGAISTFKLDDSPIQARAFISMARNQAIELRVQALGDPVDSQGNILPDLEIALKGAGEGFQSGILRKSEPIVIARWIGPGFRQGTIQYDVLNDQVQPGDFAQTVIYSLFSI